MGGRVLLDCWIPWGPGPNETLADTFREKVTLAFLRKQECEGVNVLVDSCVTKKPNQSLIQHESLILAQNERWRQA